MSIQSVLDEGYALYTFPLTHQELAEWQILAPHIPPELRIDCIISSLALLKLVNRERARIISHDLHYRVAHLRDIADYPREGTIDVTLDKLHDLEYEKTGIEYEIIERNFSIPSLALQNFHEFKDLLANNSATIVGSTRRSPIYPFDFVAGHTFIIAKDDRGELMTIDAQFDPIIIHRGDQAIRNYLQQYTDIMLYFRGRVIDSSHAKKHKIKTSVKAKSLNTMSSKAAKDTRESFFQQKKDYRNSSLTRKRGIGRGKKSRKNKRKNYK